MVYWRDKAGHGVDFVLARARGEVDAIECTWAVPSPSAHPATRRERRRSVKNKIRRRGTLTES